MMALVAAVVAAVILVFFGIGYLFGKHVSLISSTTGFANPAAK